MRFEAAADALIHAEIAKHAFSGFTSFVHRRYHQIRATHHVAACEDFWIGGLECMRVTFCQHTSARIGRNLVIVEPRLGAGAKAISFANPLLAKRSWPIGAGLSDNSISNERRGAAGNARTPSSGDAR